MAKLSTLLDQIDGGTMLLPEFQRGYVWNRDQVRGLMRSLYRGYPVGALLVWETETNPGAVRGVASVGGGTKQLLLDGQQRVTSLYGVIRGKEPAFFQGDAKAFTGLHFNVKDEVFEFYAPSKMKGDPLWIDVTGLFLSGLTPHIEALNADETFKPHFAEYLNRLTQLADLNKREFHAERITGPHLTINEVVDVFNRVNSGGTKLSKGDLALAKICADWPEARQVLRGHLSSWRKGGYSFGLDWLLRNTTAVATGKSQFSSLEAVTPGDFEKSVKETAKYVGTFLDAVGSRLGLDHDRVFMGRYAVPVVSRLLHGQGGSFIDSAQKDRVLFWYVQSALWGRFAGSTETVLAQDYDALESAGVQGLIDQLERWRGGNLTVAAHDFQGLGLGSRFYPLLYLLTRVTSAKDLGTGTALKTQLLGHNTSLQVHHLFPKALLYKAKEYGYTRAEVNSVANFCFLTQDTNLKIGMRSPEEYLAEAEQANPGVLASQWIPQDPGLWKIERYRGFLAARRVLLAEAANSFLGELRGGAAGPVEGLTPLSLIADEDQDRERMLATCIGELQDLGCAEPRRDVDILDPVDSSLLCVAEAAWPWGLQVGRGEPVILELDPEEANLERLAELGYHVFTTTEALLAEVRRRNDVEAGEVEGVEVLAG